MAHKFDELRAKMSPEARAEAHALYVEMANQMALHELRRARGISQKELAKILHIKQPNVAKMEKRTDTYISTLRAAIEAMGGTLDIVARFPDATVKITNFSSIGDDKGPDGRNKKDKKRLSTGTGTCEVMATETNSNLSDEQ